MNRRAPSPWSLSATLQLALLRPYSIIFRCGWLCVCVALFTATHAAEPSFSHVSTNPRHVGSPIVSVWTPEAYGAHPENYCVLQHPRTGLIYTGNRNGVLEYDGARWRLIRVPGGSAVSSLAVDALGRVWGCGGDSIFRLDPDAQGELQARSMTERLPAGIRPLRLTSVAVATAAGVYFKEQQHVVFLGLDDRTVRTWKLGDDKTVVLRLWKMGDDVFAMLGGNVVRQLRGDWFEPVPGVYPTVHAVHGRTDGSYLVATSEGVARWSVPAVQAQHPFSNVIVAAATFLADGTCVIATQRRGLLVCDDTGQVLQRIDRTNGLPANYATSLAPDRDGGLWVTTPSGLARVQLDTPYALHGAPQGLEGTTRSVVRHDGHLYVATTESVHRRDDDGRFRSLPDLPGSRELFSHDGWLFALGNRLRGLPPAGTEARELENRNYYGLMPLATAPGWFVHGSNSGLRWAHFAGRTWVSEGPHRAVRGGGYVVLEAPAGVMWSIGEGTWRVDFRDGVRGDGPAQAFGPAQGLPRPPAALFLLGGEIVAVSGGKLLRFDATRGRFEPETRVTGLEDTVIERAHVDDAGGIWLQGDQRAGHQIRRLVPAAPGLARWHAEPLPGGPLRSLQPTALYHDAPAHTLWIGGHGALVSQDLTWRPMHPVSPPVATVRRIESVDGEVLTVGTNPARVTLRPEHDALRIKFAAPTYRPDHTGAVHAEYRTRLDGLDRAWTAWSSQPERDFTNLPWHTFTFRVEARDAAGRVGPEAALAFSLLPPWWATRWAWTGYAALGVVSLAGVVRLRTRTHRRRAERLEAVIRHRTHELADSNSRLAASNAELARLHQLELDGKIAAQLAEEKARLEMLRYQLNPHFLYNSLNSIYGLLFANPRDAGEMVLRLSDFCRATLTPQDELPTLESEMSALRTYLEVEQVRWNDKLQVEFDLAPEVASARLPPFLLLPLIENAIKYGIRTSAGGLRLRLHARTAVLPGPDKDRDAVMIEIANTGSWVAPDPSRPDSTGIGLTNLHQRLSRYYPQAHAFTTEEKAGWVIARLLLARQPTAAGSASPLPAETTHA